MRSGSRSFAIPDSSLWSTTSSLKKAARDTRTLQTGSSGATKSPMNLSVRSGEIRRSPGLGLDRPWKKFFHTVRAANASLARDRQLRMLLGDPPIDWDEVRSPEDHRKWIEMRDTFPADRIQREVLAKGRRALLTYGQMHFQRKNLVANYESEGPAQTIVSRLENVFKAKVFTIWTSRNIAKLQADVACWPAPSVSVVRGTLLGTADFTVYYPSEVMGRFAIRDGKPDFSKQIPCDQWRTLRAEDQFEAVLYPGPEPSAIARPSPERCADKAEVDAFAPHVTSRTATVGRTVETVLRHSNCKVDRLFRILRVA
jgi:hypothetical protein